MVSISLQSNVLEQLKTALTRALAQTAEAILAREQADAVIPMDSGRMQNRQTFVDAARARNGIVEIVTDAPQAARLYFHPTYHFRRDKNANARGEWWEPWISGSRRGEAAGLFALSVQTLAKEILR